MIFPRTGLHSRCLLERSLVAYAWFDWRERSRSTQACPAYICTADGLQEAAEMRGYKTGSVSISSVRRISLFLQLSEAHIQDKAELPTARRCP